MVAILSNYDLSKFWTRTIGTNGERMVTSVNLLYREHEGGGYKSLANLMYLTERLRAVEIPQHLWQNWISNKITSPPRAVIVKLSKIERQGWVLLDEVIMRSLMDLSRDGVFDEQLAEDVRIDWEDQAFEAQWEQFIPHLPEHIRIEFDPLPKSRKRQLVWDAYVYARDRTRTQPVTTYTKAVIPVRLLAHEWLRYAKAKFPYKRRGSVPKIA